MGIVYQPYAACVLYIYDGLNLGIHQCQGGNKCCLFAILPQLKDVRQPYAQPKPLSLIVSLTDTLTYYCFLFVQWQESI